MIYKAAVLLLAFVLAVFSARSELYYKASFAQFQKKFGKTYASADEHARRFNIFKVNLDYVENFNGTFKVAMNKFGDLTNEEFRHQMNGLEVPAGYVHNSEGFNLKNEIAATVDWRTKGAVTGVKDQGQCGSCWSFSTTGSVEGCHFIATQSLVSLSEKNLMDCSWSQGNQGCNGGLMTAAMDYIISNQGIDTESSYPYDPVSSHNCRYSASNLGATLGSYTNVPSGDEGSLAQSVSQGPTSVAIDASQSSFQFYSSGVYSDPDCSSTQLDHGVLAVGYGSQSGQNYWIVKNSWGSDWGMSGYILMAKDDNNMCGIATMATLPTGCH